MSGYQGKLQPDSQTERPRQMDIHKGNGDFIGPFVYKALKTASVVNKKPREIYLHSQQKLL